MKFPKGLNKKQKKYLKEVYLNALKSKKKEPLKAKSFAKARFYEEAFKIFIKKENKVSYDYKKLFEKTKTNIEYKKYPVGSLELITSVDKKILEKYKNAERKGLLKDMDDEFEQEILFKVKEEYGVRFHPEMYYVIK